MLQMKGINFLQLTSTPDELYLAAVNSKNGPKKLKYYEYPKYPLPDRESRKNAKCH